MTPTTMMHRSKMTSGMIEVHARREQQLGRRCSIQETDSQTIKKRHSVWARQDDNCADASRRTCLVSIGVALHAALSASSSSSSSTASLAATEAARPNREKLPPLNSVPPLGITTESSQQVAMNAIGAYSERNFRDAERELTVLLAREPNEAKWYEARGQVRVDAKLFADAIDDYNMALKITSGYVEAPKGLKSGNYDIDINSAAFAMDVPQKKTDRARLLSGRALAYEGLSLWERALEDYDEALQLAIEDGKYEDPYVLNSRGNVKASLGRYEDARDDYCRSAEGFRAAKGFLDRDGRSNRRLDGEVFAQTNASLMLVQYGNEREAIKEMKNVARKAPYSVDIHAALATMHWHLSEEEEAENQWQFACDRINTGCLYYKDINWVEHIRRWPPVMVTRLKDFLAVNDSEITRKA